jgi:hypothetical protein
MKKWIGGILIVLLVLVVATVLVLALATGKIIRTGIETAGPKVLGVPVSLADVDVKLLQGKARMNDLVIGNPEGYKTESSFRMGQLYVSLDTGSLMGDKIIVEEVLIAGPEITYEVGLGNSNIGTLLKGIEEKTGGETADATEPEPADDTAAEGGKAVVIRSLKITDGRIRISAKLLAGRSLSIPLPTVHLKDIGEKQDGASLPQVIAQVMREVSKATLSAVASSSKLAGEGIKVAADTAFAVAGAATDAAAGTVKAVGDVGGKAVSTAADAAGKTVGAAGDAAGQAVGAVGDVAGKTVGAAGDVAGKTVGAAGDVAGKTVGAAGDAAGKTIGAAGDVAGKAVGGAVGVAGKGVGAVGKGVGSVGKGAGRLVGGLLGRGRDKEEPAQTNTPPEAVAPDTK